MSPLASVLIAFGALLATAADAKITKLPQLVGGTCAGVIIDVPLKYTGTDQEIKFNFKGDGNEQLHNITNVCQMLGAEIASETVRVCNDFDHPKVPVWYPPKVRALHDEYGREVLSTVFAACYPEVELSGECSGLTFHITQKCRFAPVS